MNENNVGKKILRERRAAPRIETSNFVGFVCLDESGNEISEGYGWTLDLSLGGIKIETFRPIETQYILVLAIDFKDELLEIKGEVAHFRELGEDRYVVGVRFIDEGEKQRRLITNFVKSYYKSRKRPT